MKNGIDDLKKRPKSPGRHARNKGYGFERWVANALKGLYPEARRQLEYHENDCKGIDLANTGPFKIQCKKLRKYARIVMIEEVVCDSVFGDIPVLITAADNKPAMAVLPLTEFIRLVESTNGIYS